MTERELVKELSRLQALPTTTEDWRDLYETIEAYKWRCLGRAIAAAPRREEIIATIRKLAEVNDDD
jgi:hypothetical protein